MQLLYMNKICKIFLILFIFILLTGCSQKGEEGLTVDPPEDRPFDVEWVNLFPQIFSIQFVTRDIGWGIGNGDLIYHTNDGGKTWSQQKSEIYAKKTYFTDPNTGWAIGQEPNNPYENIYHTIDGGFTWKNQTRNLNLKKSYFIDIYFASDSKKGYAVGGTGEDNGYYGILLRTDDGRVWEKEYLNNKSTNLYIDKV